MHGYLRRKVTYNLGRGGNSAPAPRHRGIPHNRGRLSGGIFGIFTAHNELVNSDVQHVIVDDTGQWPIDNNYADKGRKEGWLIDIGQSRGPNEELIYRYRLRE